MMVVVMMMVMMVLVEHGHLPFEETRHFHKRSTYI